VAREEEEWSRRMKRKQLKLELQRRREAMKG
jgi:hypothetical protein